MLQALLYNKGIFLGMCTDVHKNRGEKIGKSQLKKQVHEGRIKWGKIEIQNRIHL
jgi:hypothetical protein